MCLEKLQMHGGSGQSCVFQIECVPLGERIRTRITLLHTPYVEGSDTSTCQAVMIYHFTGEDAPVADRTKFGSTYSSGELLLFSKVFLQPACVSVICGVSGRSYLFVPMQGILLS